VYKLAGRLLHVVLVVLLLGSVIVQIVVPQYATQVATVNPEVSHLVAPYSGAAMLFIGCLQVALLVVWRLVSLVDRGAVFTRDGVRCVDLITACAVVATALTTGVLVHMLGFVPGGGGPMIYYMAACITAGLAGVLLALVVRGVLLDAVAGQTAPPAER
jgi:hypothetical protein